jgi:phage/plasmid primase-like uncharacterized protein
VAVTSAQRHSPRNPCPVCGGHANMRHGQGARCYGFTSEDGRYTRCTRVECAGKLAADAHGSYLHSMEGSCDCGLNHTKATPTPRIEPHRERDFPSTSARAMSIWAESSSAAGTVVEQYLAARGLTTAIPPTLRYHLGPEGSPFPAMVAAVADGTGRVTGIHMTFIALDGQSKAPLATPKKRLGSVPGGAVWLGLAGPVLMLCEGIEDGLALMAATTYPCWAVMGAGNLATVDLTTVPAASRIIIASDGDAAGIDGAWRAAERLTREGRRVEVAKPESNLDWNEMLITEASNDHEHIESDRGREALPAS